MDLELDSVRACLDNEMHSNPENPYLFYYNHYTCFLNTLLSGITADYEQFMGVSGKLTEALRESDSNHPEYLFLLSSMNLQRAFLNFYYGDQWQGIKNFYTAYRMAKQNSYDYPLFNPNLKIEGISELIISSVPENYKWILNWLGIGAELREAIGKLERYYATCSAEEKPEALIILALAYGQILVDREKAYALLQGCEERTTNRSIVKPFLAYYASVSGHVSEAVRVLESGLQQGEIWRNQAALLLGTAKLNGLEQEAGQYLEDFLWNYKGINHIRTAHHKLSWYYLINGDTTRYIRHKQMVLSAGTDLFATDKQATAEASVPGYPDIHLLKARLLFDGSMYDWSLEILENICMDELDTEKEQQEFAYRMARVCQKLEMTARAKELYQAVLATDHHLQTYYAPYSALQLGLMAESEGRYEEAVKYYETCLEINKGEYRSGIEREAKMRLERLRNQ